MSYFYSIQRGKDFAGTFLTYGSNLPPWSCVGELKYPIPFAALKHWSHKVTTYGKLGGTTGKHTRPFIGISVFFYFQIGKNLRKELIYLSISISH